MYFYGIQNSTRTKGMNKAKSTYEAIWVDRVFDIVELQLRG